MLYFECLKSLAWSYFLRLVAFLLIQVLNVLVKCIQKGKGMATFWNCMVYHFPLCIVVIILCDFILYDQCIGAVNTIIRRPRDGKLIGYNTDCEACISAIEDALRGNVIFFARGIDMHYKITLFWSL